MLFPEPLNTIDEGIPVLKAIYAMIDVLQENAESLFHNASDFEQFNAGVELLNFGLTTVLPRLETQIATFEALLPT